MFLDDILDEAAKVMLETMQANTEKLAELEEDPKKVYAHFVLIQYSRLPTLLAFQQCLFKTTVLVVLRLHYACLVSDRSTGLRV